MAIVFLIKLQEAGISCSSIEFLQLHHSNPDTIEKHKRNGPRSMCHLERVSEERGLHFWEAAGNLRVCWYHWVTRPKNFIETDTETFFRDQNFRDRDFFSRPNIFETDTETFFWDQMFSRPIPRLFSRPNVFETDTETFFRDQMFSRPIPRLFWDQIFSRLIPRLLQKLKSKLAA